MYILHLFYNGEYCPGKHIFERKFFSCRRDAEMYAEKHANFAYADLCGIDDILGDVLFEIIEV